ncbi:hypothetical protein D4739_02135 [Nocardioides cavernaquae]|uniref:Uncharacterized protein n=1 Tax=Nocardioides cavernaquae TaxID=2321396 RepID=A0A3A5H5F9_9ACTN|nr:hypothetical protein D4739_02135 [Nocardioides cavernaquae]
MIAELDNRRDGVAPMYLPGVEQTFRDELDLLSALSLKWHTRLSGRLERVMSEEPLNYEAAVIGAWRDNVAELPGIRLALDAALAGTDAEILAVIGKSQAKEHELLALWSGRVSAYQLEEYGDREGAKVELLAREGFEFPAAVEAPAEPLSFLERLKAAVA